MHEKEESASPQEQAMYDSIAVPARAMIYGEQSEAIVKKLESGDPAEAIGHTAAMVLRSVTGGIEQKGRKVPPDVMIASLDDVISDLVDLASAGKIIDRKQESEIAAAALERAVKVLKGEPQQAQQPQPGLVASAMGG